MVFSKFSSCQQCLPFTWLNQTFHLKNFRKRGFGSGGGGEAMFVLFSVCFPFVGVACEQALRGGAGQGGKRKESLQIHLWNLNSISNSPVALRQLSCHISTNQGEAEMSAKLM